MFERIDFIGALRRGWRLVAALAVVGFVVAILIPVSTPKAKGVDAKYHWRSTVIVGVEPAGGIGLPGVNGATVLFWANDYYTRAAACAMAGLGYQYGPLSALMTANQTTFASGAKATGKAATKATKGSSVVQLTADGSSKSSAVLLANQFAVAVGQAVNKAYAAHVAALTAGNAGSKSPISSAKASTAESGYQVLVPATIALTTRVKTTSSKLTSSKKVRGLAGIVIGLILAGLIILARELTDRTIRSAGGAEGATHYPVLLEIPEAVPASGVAPVLLAVTEDPRSKVAEGYRMLRMSVLFEELAASQPPPDLYGYPPAPWEEAASNGHGTYSKPEPGSRQVVLIVSPSREETRPIVAVNLCATYAEAGQKVIVISTDDVGAGPSYFDGGQQAGVVGPTDVAAHLQPSSLANVSRLSFRHFVSNSGQLVTRAPEVLRAARQLADVIVVESPPFLESHHGEALVHAVDVVLLLTESRTTTLDQGKRTGNLLRRIGAPVLGVVLTNVRTQHKAPAAAAADPKTAPPAPPPIGEPLAIAEVTKS
jgi:Mrp family chromosome partitioning ATPase/capsular polysaccharide biosynthesis protein